VRGASQGQGARQGHRVPCLAAWPLLLCWWSTSCGGWVGGGGSGSQLVDCIGERGYAPGPHYLAMAGPSLYKPTWCHPPCPWLVPYSRRPNPPRPEAGCPCSLDTSLGRETYFLPICAYPSGRYIFDNYGERTTHPYSLDRTDKGPLYVCEPA